MFSHQNGCVILYLLAFSIGYFNTSPVNISITKFSEDGLLRIKRQSSGTCNFPIINNGKVAVIRQNPSYLFLNISCDETYNLFPPNNNLGKCVNGNWENEIPQCIKCGQRLTSIFQPLIVNGTNAKFGYFPWHVAIYQTTELIPEQKYICGGSIINEKNVLSVAHCFTDDGGKVIKTKEFFIAAGKFYSRYNSELDKYAQKRKIDKINIHPDFKGILTNYGWDIAVVAVDQPFEISNIIQPVCIDWTTLFENEQLVDDNYGQVPGWGFTETNLQTSSSKLRMLSVPFVNRVQCLKHVPSDFYRYVTYDKICAGYVNGSSICNGDSGGGLVFERIENQKTTYYIRGLLSLGVQSDGTCDSSKYSTYTKVSVHMNFIRESITPSQIVVTKTDLNTKPNTPSASVRNFLSNKYMRFLPSGNNCGDPINIEYKIRKGSVKLGYNKNGERKKFKCTGALISTKYVLTAAYCTVGKIIDEFGDLVLVAEIMSKYEYELQEIIPHPDYVASSRSNNIALLRVRPKLEQYKYLVPANSLCLATNKEKKRIKSKIFLGLDVITNLELEKFVKFVDPTDSESCSQIETKLALNQKCHIIRENVCDAVEGGIIGNIYPANTFYLEGIVSRSRCNANRSEVEYTLVADYIVWIIDNMKS